MKHFLLLIVLGVSACESTPIATINDKYRDLLKQRETQYRIKPGDSITIKFYNQDAELNQTVLVLPDGHTDPFFMDDVPVAGKAVKELEDDIRRYYADQVRDAELSISLLPSGETVVVEGEVLKPIQIPLTLRMTLLQAIAIAGGYKITACLHTVVVRRYIKDPEHPETFRVNLTDRMDTNPDLLLLPNDHILLERNWVILVRDYINEYIWGFLPPFFRSMPGVASLPFII
jgi:protein involved in polysaccharide export with SLBB domain